MQSEAWERNLVNLLSAAAQDGDAQERITAKAELFKLTKSVHGSVSTAAWNEIRKIPK